VEQAGAGGSIPTVSDRGSQIVAEVLLVAVAAVWGWTFVMVKDAVALVLKS
jgi:hypothetical protein